MFTGLIDGLGTLTAATRAGGKLRLSVKTTFLEPVKIGDSVAIDGCCLTVIAANAGVLSFDAAEETLRRTTLGGKRVGDSVHVERAMPASGRFDGHIVQGHVDCVAEVKAMRPDGDAVWLTLSVPAAVTRYMVEKGSVTFDGVSLTLTEVGHDQCSVMLVPHTQEKTHLAKKAVGDTVNIEVDVLAKYVERLLEAKK